MNVTIDTVSADQLGAVATAIARWQGEPATHICYLSMEPEAIAGDLEGLEPAALDASLGAWRGDEVVGFMAAEWDTAPPRVWWHGPFADFSLPCHEDLADVLYERLRLSIPREVEEEELAVDDRHATVAGFADRHGFNPVDDPSAVLVLAKDARASCEAVPEIEVETITDQVRPDVIRLHDQLFPGTHTPGARLASSEHHDVVLVAHDGVQTVGYIGAERQGDGSGYIDFVGVDEGSRGRGIGRLLVVSAVDRLRALGCGEISLTVLASNHTARRLYTMVGFEEERILRAWRKGF